MIRTQLASHGRPSSVDGPLAFTLLCFDVANEVRIGHGNMEQVDTGIQCPRKSHGLNPHAFFQAEINCQQDSIVLIQNSLSRPNSPSTLPTSHPAKTGRRVVPARTQRAFPSPAAQRPENAAIEANPPSRRRCGETFRVTRSISSMSTRCWTAKLASSRPVPLSTSRSGRRRGRELPLGRPLNPSAVPAAAGPRRSTLRPTGTRSAGPGAICRAGGSSPSGCPSRRPDRPHRW